MAKDKPLFGKKQQRQIRRHDRKAYKQRAGKKFNTKPPKRGGCLSIVVGLAVVGATTYGVVKGIA